MNLIVGNVEAHLFDKLSEKIMNSSAVIKMPKRFDYSSSTEFNNAISKALEAPGAITLDCRELDYIDSAGIGLLVMSEKKSAITTLKISND